MRARLLVVLFALSACDPRDNDSLRRTPAPALASPPVVSLEPHVDIGGTLWARQGATLDVALDVEASEGFDEDASAVFFTGVPLAYAGDGVWSRQLSGEESSGVKTLDVVLVDEIGQQTRLSFDGDDTDAATGSALQVGFDFNGPQADCIISPRRSNAQQDVTVRVLANEALSSRPQLTFTDASVVATATEGDAGDRDFAWTVSFADRATLQGWSFAAMATDRVGNPPRAQDGASLCTVAPTGDHFGEGLVASDIARSLAGTNVDGATVGVGARVTVSFTTDRPLDLAASQVQIGDLSLAYDPIAASWTREIGPGDTNGPKTLVLTLFDDVGNRSVVRRDDLAVVVDTTPPTASCALSPQPANASSDVVFSLQPTEPLGAPPVWTSQEVQVGPPTQAGDRWLGAITSPPDVDVDFSLSVSITDRVGNTATDDAVCEPMDRSGRIAGRAPTVDGDLLLVVSPSVPGDGGLARAREGATLVVTLPTDDDIDPDASRVSLGGIALSSTDGEVWATGLQASAGDGRKELSALLIDSDGNVLQVVDPDIAFLADFTPPAVASSSATRTPFLASALGSDAAEPLHVTDVDPFIGGPVTARVTLVTTEALGAPPTLSSSALGLTDAPASSWGGRTATWDLGPVDAMPTGEIRFTATLTDEVGNTATDVEVEASLLVDRQPPEPISEGPDATTLLVRAPWGSASSGGEPYVAVQGGPGSAEPGALLLAFDDSGRRLTDGLAEADGRFGPLQLPADADVVEIVQLDRAGNPSAPAKVRRTRWTASLGDKVSGSVVGNPHELVGLRRLGPAWDPGQADRVEPATSDYARMGTPDGQTWSSTTASRWTAVTSDDDAPDPRSNAAVAYDPSRGVLLMFGGSGTNGRLSDTWEWDGRLWRRVVPRTSPSAREDASLAWDPSGGRMLLFGGDGGSGRLQDTWRYDGADWTPVSTPYGPARREGAAIATDPVRGQVLLFGGQDTTGGTTTWFTETWVWEGDAWRRLEAPGGPASRSEHAMAWDPVRQEIVLFGGSGPEGNLSDTWAWNGEAWQRRPTTTQPTARFGHRMAWDPVREEVLLFGGSDGTFRKETWSWNGATWTRLTPGSPPPARIWSNLVTDPARGEVVLFGGLRGGTFTSLQDTWIWDGSAWTERVPSVLPAARYGHGLTAHPSGDGLLMFGGKTGFDQDQQDLWRWDGWSWQPVAAAGGPTARESMVFATDPDRRQALLFGGQEGEEGALFGGPTYLGDWWAFDGTSWSTPDPPALPGARYGAAGAWDPARGRLLVFGGRYDDDALSPLTFLWDGAEWSIASNTEDPTARRGAAMAWDEDAAEMVLFGGTDEPSGVGGELGDTWVWIGPTWSRVTSTGGPSPRTGASLAWDDHRHRLVLFGGGSVAQGVQEDTWTWDGDSWTQEPTTTAPPARAFHGTAVDPTRDEIVLFGGLRGGLDLDPLTWRWDGGSEDAAAQRFDVRLGEARAPEGRVLEALLVRWIVGGRAAGTPGADLLAWRGDQWMTLASHTGSPEAPDELCWQLVATESPPEPGCVQVVDAELAARLISGPEETLSFAVRTRGTRGDAAAAASLATDAVEVSVTYLPPPVSSVPYATSFEGCADWALAGDWSCAAPGVGPATAPDGLSVLATAPAGTYGNDHSFDVHAATSPWIAVPGAGATLSFDAWWHIEEAPYDGAHVAIKAEGEPWVVLPTSLAYDGVVQDRPAWTDDASAQGWRRVSADLSPWAGQTIRLRFALASDDSVTRPGLYVDDLRIE